MSWNKEIINIYNLATLHSWIIQIDQMLEDFIRKYESNNEIIHFLINQLKEKNVPTEHYIISLVLLNYFKYPTVDIIEYANDSLYGKISKNDIQFFKKHLFSDSFPLSIDLSYDITNRSFLSPKKAIEKAMRINSVISRENPILTVLYMNFILSRIDMNEENRAMVAFLLLRVDIELPGGLKDRVYKYLWEYRDVIKELLEEEDGGSISIDDIQSLKKKITKLEIIKITNDDDKNIKGSQNTVDGFKTITVDPDVITIPKNLKAEKRSNNSNTDLSSIKTEHNGTPSPGNGNRIFLKAMKKVIDNVSSQDKSTGSDQSDSSIGQTNKDNGIHDAFSLYTKENIESKTIISGKKLKPQGHSKQDNVKSIVSKESPADNENRIIGNNKIITNDNISENGSLLEEKKENKWEIVLRKNREILESILYGISKKSNKTLSLNKRKGLKNNEIDQQKKTQSTRRKDKKTYVSILFVLILIMTLVLVFNNTNKGNIGKSSIDTSVAIIPEQGNEEEPVGYIANQTKADFAEKPIPEDFPINFTIKGNNIVWKVVEGDSISGFFYALQDFKPRLVGTKLENISKMEWTEFFNNFVKNNPRRISYHIIYPSEVFTLPLE